MIMFHNPAYPAACDPAYPVNLLELGTHLRDEPEIHRFF